MGSAGLNTEISEALKPIVFYDFTREGMLRLVKALTSSRFNVDENLINYRFERSLEPATRHAYGCIMQWVKDHGGLHYQEAYIARVHTPTLIVNGKDDIVVPLNNAYRFLELMPKDLLQK